MADSKLTALSEISVPALEDLTYLVDDPAGTPASRKVPLNRLFGASAHLFEMRLTGASGKPVYFPVHRLTPSSTDTTAETTTFATPHGWVTGTMVLAGVTGGGLTAATVYYINAVSTTAISYHTTLADALAATSPVNLMAPITAVIIPIGIQFSTLRLAFYGGNKVRLYDGTRWKVYAVGAEITLAMSGLTSGKNYDIFLYDDSGTLTLELSAEWTDDNTRADALAVQDGVEVKSGATTRLWIGTGRTVSTSAMEMSWNSFTAAQNAKMFLWNRYNQIVVAPFTFDSGSHTYNSGTIREWGGLTTTRVEFVSGIEHQPYQMFVSALMTVNATTDNPQIYINGNGITTSTPNASLTGLAALTARQSADRPSACLLGWNYVTLSESEAGTTTATFSSAVVSAIYMG